MSEIDKGKSRVSGVAKKGTVGLTKGVVKGGAKVGGAALKGIVRGSRKLAIKICGSTFVGAVVALIVVAAMLTTAIMGTAISMTSDTEMKKQSPELTKAYLNSNEDAFKSKVMELVQDERFRSYVMNGEFDNAYTKLVYGGTKAYTGKEIQSYAKADAEDRTWLKFTSEGKKINKLYKRVEELQLTLQEEGVKACKKEIKKALKKDASVLDTGFLFFKSNEFKENLEDALETKSSDKIARNLERAKNSVLRFIDKLADKDSSESGKYAKIKCLLNTLQADYISKGVDPANIKISDQYLKGYGRASGYYKADQDEISDKINKRLTAYNNIKNANNNLTDNQFKNTKVEITNVKVSKNNVKFTSKNKVVFYKNGSSNGVALDKGFVRVKVKEGDFITLQDDVTKKYVSFKVKKGLKIKKLSIDEEIKNLKTELSNLKGQDRTNEVMEEELPFDKWINYSYYTIPYYYHVNMARNSEYQNRLGGTLSDSEKFYANLVATFGPGLAKSLGKLFVIGGVAGKAKNNKARETFKKSTNKLLKTLKNPKKRKKAAEYICSEENKKAKAQNITASSAIEKLQDANSEGAIQAGKWLYEKGTKWQLNTYESLLKTLTETPDLQLGLPNWNVDSGNWQFMTYETKDVNKYESYYATNDRMAAWYYLNFETNGMSKKQLKELSKHYSIWNNQMWLTAVGKEGFNDSWLGTVVTSWFGKNALADGTNWYNTELSKYNPEYFHEMSYKEILNTGFTNYYKGKTSVKDLDYKKTKEERNINYYPAKGVMLGYKQLPVQSDWDSTINGMLGYDEFYKYYAFTKDATNCFNYNAPRTTKPDGKSNFESDFMGFVNNLYIHKWEDTIAENSKYSNYVKYLANINDVDTVSKREKANKKSVDNSEISKLIDQFASYFINQIYFTYSDNIDDNGGEDTPTGGGSDYIRDYFLSDSVSKTKKIAFLQRSFYAMATGAAFTYDSEEEYSVKNNKISSWLNGSVVGELELNSKIKLKKIKYYQTLLSRITNMTEFGGTVEIVSKLSVPRSIDELNEERWHKNPTEEETAIALNEMLRAMAEDKLLYNGEQGRKELQSIYKRYKNDVMGWYESPNLNNNNLIPFTIEYDAEILCTDKKGKEIKKKGTVTVEYCKVEGMNCFRPKYTIKINEEKDVNDIIYSQTKWNKEFYENHECDIKEKGYTFDGDYSVEYNGGTISDIIPRGDLSLKGLGKKINALLGGSFPISGNLKGERDIVIDYQTAGFLTYDIQEEKDDAGNISEVHANVYIKFPEEEMITRLAYAWEREGMLNEALKLYKIYTDQGNLQDAESKVDLNELIINYNPNEGDIDDEDIENANLPSMVKPEMVRAAFRSQEEYKVPVSSTLGQIILESGGKYEGLSQLAFEQKNLFGMKSGKNKWTIGSKAYATKEQSENGTTYGITADFSVYKSWTDAIMDRADLLTSYSRVGYGQHTKPFLNNNPKKYTPKKAIQFVASYSYPNKPAWATDHEYLSKMRDIMEKHNLFQYDNMTYAEYKATVTGGANGTGIEGVLSLAYEQHGKKYVFGANGPDTFDCSGLVQYCFKHAAGIDVTRSTQSQPKELARLARQGDKTSGNFYVMEIKDPKDLKRGDLVYTRGHVVFYINKNTQYDASSHYPSTLTKKKGKDFWPKDIGEHPLSLKNVVKMFRVVIITEGDEFINMSDSYLVTPLGQSVLTQAAIEPSTGANWCARWTKYVYRHAGIKIPDLGSAIEHWTGRKKYFPTWKSHKFAKGVNNRLLKQEYTNIPPGALVIGRGKGDMGRKYGHIGIYLGNGKVISNLSSQKPKPETMQSFEKWQEATGGLEGWIAPKGMVKIFKCQLKGANLSELEFKKLKKTQLIQTLSKNSKCTAYCTCAECCDKSTGITASGAKFKAYYTCAVDKSIIPLGSDVYVKYKGRYFKYKAQDTGGDIKGTRVDLAFPTHKSAMKWGSAYLPVYFVAKKNRSSKEMKKISKAKTKKNLPLNQTFNFNSGN